MARPEIDARKHFVRHLRPHREKHDVAVVQHVLVRLGNPYLRKRRGELGRDTRVARRQDDGATQPSIGTDTGNDGRSDRARADKTQSHERKIFHRRLSPH